MRMKLTLLSLFFVLATVAQGQARIYVKGFRYDSAVLLRWYPKDMATWLALFEKPIEIYKKEIHQPSARIEIVATGIRLDTGAQFKAFISSKPAAGFVLETLRNSENTTSEVAEIRKKQKEEQTALLYSMLLLQKDFELSMQLGMASMDQNIDPNKSYIYYIKSAGGLIQDSISLIPELYDRNIPFGKPELVSIKSQVVLAWHTEGADAAVAAVHLQRSTDTGRTWKYITSEPLFRDIQVGESRGIKLISDEFGDESDIWYRWIPINYFGFELPPGEMMHCSLRRPALAPEIVKNEQGLVEWLFDSGQENQLSGFKIYQADSIFGNFSLLHDTVFGVSSRTAPLIAVQGSKYLVVAATDLNGEEYWSDPVLVQAIDSFAPDVPAGIVGSIDSVGIVRIQWKHPEAPDLLGYMVYSSNSRNTEYAPVLSQWDRDTHYVDTLDLGWMRDSVYYKVVSSDTRYNESEASEIVALKVPGVFIPDAPRITQVYDSAQSVFIEFAASTNRQVSAYEIIRINNGDTLLLDRIPSTLKSMYGYADAEVVVGTDYEYSVRAISAQNTFSNLAPWWKIHVQEPLYLEAIQGVSLWLDSAQQRYYLQWQKPTYAVKHFRVVQLIQGKPHTVMTVNGDTFEVKLPPKKQYAMKELIIIAYDFEGRSSIW